jgi:hypothetical protein
MDGGVMDEKTFIDAILREREALRAHRERQDHLRWQRGRRWYRSLEIWPPRGTAFWRSWVRDKQMEMG